jgi:hypothetical protein
MHLSPVSTRQVIVPCFCFSLPCAVFRIICNTYCFSMAAVFMRTHLSVTFIHTVPILLYDVLSRTQRGQNCMHEEAESRLNSGNT